MFDWISETVEAMGYGGVALFMFLENVFPPIPSEVVMPVAGFVAARGGMNLWLAVAVGTLGSLAGAVLWYVVGRRIGEERLCRWIERHGRWLALTPEDLNRSRRWFRERGGTAVLVGRVVPAIRTFVSLPAGFARMPFGPFLLYTTLGTFVWTLALAWAGHVLEANYDAVERFLSPATWIVLGAILAGYVWRVARWRLGGDASGANGDEGSRERAEATRAAADR